MTKTVSSLGCILALFTGCNAYPSVQCRSSIDCRPGYRCTIGECIRNDEIQDRRSDASADSASLREAADDSVTEVETDSAEESEENLTSETPTSACDSRPTTQSLRINEVLANVPTGAKGDANQNGKRETFGDEFIEIVNTGDNAVQLEGTLLRDGDDTIHTFERRCLHVSESTVVFDQLSDNSGPFGDAVAVEASEGTHLSNASGHIILESAGDKSIDEMSYNESPRVSLTLKPELTGENYVPHTELDTDLMYSAGVCADGGSFATDCK